MTRYSRELLLTPTTQKNERPGQVVGVMAMLRQLSPLGRRRLLLLNAFRQLCPRNTLRVENRAGIR